MNIFNMFNYINFYKLILLLFFMDDYYVDWYKANVAIPNSETQGPYGITIHAENLVDAKKQATKELIVIGIRRLTSNVVAARIRKEPAGKWHVLCDCRNVFGDLEVKLDAEGIKF